MFGSLLPNVVIEWGTDLLFITGVVAGAILGFKWIRGVLHEAREVVDDDDDSHLPD